MKKRICITVGVVLLVAALFVGIWNWYIPDFSALLPIKSQYAADYTWNEQLCNTFFQNHMISQQKEIYTNFWRRKKKGIWQQDMMFYPNHTGY